MKHHSFRDGGEGADAFSPAPFIDVWGRETYANPYGHNRPNPAFVAFAQQVAVAGPATEAVTDRVHRHVRRAVAVAVALSSSVLGVTAASAYLTAAGTGTGSSTAGTLTVSVLSATASSSLYPGGSSTLSVELGKPNDALTLTGIAPGPGSVQVTGGTCSTPAITVATNNALNIPVGTGTDVTVPIPNGVSMGTGASNNCQGATFSIPVTITVKQP